MPRSTTQQQFVPMLPMQPLLRASSPSTRKLGASYNNLGRAFVLRSARFHTAATPTDRKAVLDDLRKIRLARERTAELIKHKIRMSRR